MTMGIKKTSFYPKTQSNQKVEFSFLITYSKIRLTNPLLLDHFFFFWGRFGRFFWKILKFFNPDCSISWRLLKKATALIYATNTNKCLYSTSQSQINTDRDEAQQSSMTRQTLLKMGCLIKSTQENWLIYCVGRRKGSKGKSEALRDYGVVPVMVSAKTGSKREPLYTP